MEWSRRIEPAASLSQYVVAKSIYEASTGGTTMKDLSVLAIDLAKTSFHLQGNDSRGKPLFKKALKRHQLEAFVANLPKCTVAMEACGSAHFWARRFAAHGHLPKLIAPQFVAPFRQGNKNDRNDTGAIGEAASRPTMRFVPVKSAEQLDLQAVHRVRTRRMSNRTALLNEMRGILFEQGIALAQGVRTLKTFVSDLLHGEPKETVSKACRETVADLSAELLEIEEHIAEDDRRLARHVKQDERCQRLQSVPGIGPITASALVVAVSDPLVFKNGRHFAAWLGLVPRHSGTGGADKNRVGRISKRGDMYLRRLLVSGAQAVLRTADKREDRYGARAKALKERVGWNKAAVAVANRNARMAWALMAGGGRFDADHGAQGEQPA
jgi:transposase